MIQGGVVVNGNDSMPIAEIVNLLLKEIQVPTLQSIPYNTYQKIATTLENLQMCRYQGMEAIIRDTMVEMISTVSAFLLEVRHLKVLNKQGALSSVSSSSPSDTAITHIRNTAAAIDYSKLTEEEKYILDADKESEGRRNDILAAIIRGRPKVLESISKRVRFKQIVVRFVKPMELFMGVDMKRYGPFRQEDVAVIPFENARSLIESNHAIHLQSTYQ